MNTSGVSTLLAQVHTQENEQVPWHPPPLGGDCAESIGITFTSWNHRIPTDRAGRAGY